MLGKSSRSEAVGAGFHRLLAELAQGLLDGLEVFAVVAVDRSHPFGGAPLLAERIGFELAQDFNLFLVRELVVLKDRHDLPLDVRHGKSSRLLRGAPWHPKRKETPNPEAGFLAAVTTITGLAHHQGRSKGGTRRQSDLLEEGRAQDQGHGS